MLNFTTGKSLRTSLRTLAMVMAVVSWACMWAPAAMAQCVAGDVLWVAETVNANVGTGAASGASAQCAARTVAGAAYNNIGQPFGIQAAFDCACPGSEIRIQAGVNNYDSTTASWTNRLAGSEVQIPAVIALLSGAGPMRVIGYAGGSPCNLLQDTGCPVVLDFATGTADGLDNNGGNVGLGIIGLHITNAAQICLSLDGTPSASVMSVELSNCGTAFSALGTTDHSYLYMYSHDSTNGAQPPDFSSMLFAEGHDNVNDGIDLGSGGHIERFLAYDQSVGGGVGYGSSSASQLLYGTMANNADSGWLGGAGVKANTGGLNLIATGNGAWGMESFIDSTRVMSMFECWVAGGNVSGAFTPSSVLAYGIGSNLDSTTVPTFASATDFSVSGVAACSFSYPGTTTVSTSCPGASPTCVGGGLFIQPVR